ncbi:hypothetical protein HanXRQr2_Chr02g0059091 [Helianthus annuus]|uniref:Uncharacterized protein n=1 Tax=Helianthus annuus TaxID=4232 RepID=A0A9K3JN61_HELAN|nr:hypothetical protein HanXRQr2_Chr02g0059091 [Helianthus annuus]
MFGHVQSTQRSNRVNSVRVRVKQSTQSTGQQSTDSVRFWFHLGSQFWFNARVNSVSVRVSRGQQVKAVNPGQIRATQ